MTFRSLSLPQTLSNFWSRTVCSFSCPIAIGIRANKTTKLTMARSAHLPFMTTLIASTSSNGIYADKAHSKAGTNRLAFLDTDKPLRTGSAVDAFSAAAHLLITALSTIILPLAGVSCWALGGVVRHVSLQQTPLSPQGSLSAAPSHESQLLRRTHFS